MITMRELLKDRTYKNFICKPPILPPNFSTPSGKPWRLYAKMPNESHWRSKEFSSYKEAFSSFKKLLNKAEDLAINSKALDYRPPKRLVRIKGQYLVVQGEKIQKTREILWQPTLSGEWEEHHWCPYCRRPSVFKPMYEHYKLGVWLKLGVPIDYEALHCSICGTSNRLINLKSPETHQKWSK